MPSNGILTQILTPTHNYGTRGQNSAVPEFRRLASTQRSLSYSAPTVWNSLPSEVQHSETLPIFKRTLKEHLLNGYN